MLHYDRTCLSTHLPEASAKKNRSIRSQKHNAPAAPYREAGSYVQASKGTLRPLSALPSWPREAQRCSRPSQKLQRRSEASRVGKEWVSTCRSRGSPCHTKINRQLRHKQKVSLDIVSSISR